MAYNPEVYGDTAGTIVDRGFTVIDPTQATVPFQPNGGHGESWGVILPDHETAYGDNWIMQPFTSGAGGRLDGVSLWLTIDPAVSDDDLTSTAINTYLCPDIEGAPDLTNPIASDSIGGNALIKNEMTRVTARFDWSGPGPALDPATTYWIGLDFVVAPAAPYAAFAVIDATDTLVSTATATQDVTPPYGPSTIADHNQFRVEPLLAGFTWALPATEAGYGAYASGKGASASGIGTSATGDGSHAEGMPQNGVLLGPQATSDGSHAEGIGTYATGGQGSHAEGQDCRATNLSTHAEGLGSSASGPVSHAEGFGTVASGSSSHAQNVSTVASGYCSDASGWHGTAALPGERAHGGASGFVGQYSRVIAVNETADDTPTALLLLKGDAFESPITVPDGETWQVTAHVAASDHTTPGTVAGWILKGLVSSAGGALRVVGSPTAETWADAGASAWVAALAVVADHVDVTVTGVADTTIRWVATVHATRVGV